MARSRTWDALSASTQKRYIATGKRLGQSADEVRRYYESGGSMSVYRGHAPKHGLSEYRWRKLRKAAKDAGLEGDLTGGDTVSGVLESLLRKGFSYEWILKRLIEKKESRDAYRDPVNVRLRAEGAHAGRQPGNERYHKRALHADIEIYFYH